MIVTVVCPYLFHSASRYSIPWFFVFSTSVASAEGSARDTVIPDTDDHDEGVDTPTRISHEILRCGRNLGATIVDYVLLVYATHPTSESYLL